eukprot:scaffold155051_cov39-Cyclotella_meneghiniana.AAC.1
MSSPQCVIRSLGVKVAGLACGLHSTIHTKIFCDFGLNQEIHSIPIYWLVDSINVITAMCFLVAGRDWVVGSNVITTMCFGVTLVRVRVGLWPVACGLQSTIALLAVGKSWFCMGMQQSLQIWLPPRICSIQQSTPDHSTTRYNVMEKLRFVKQPYNVVEDGSLPLPDHKNM